VLTATEDRVAAVQVLFHPDATSPELLPWLAGWFDATLSPEWSEAKRRFFLRNAMSFFHWRGTARGLRLAARVALAPDDQLCDALLGDPPGPVRIVERFTTRAPLRAARLSAATGIGSWDPAATWSEAEGATGLLGRWRALHPSSGVPLVPGIDDDFLKTHLGFVPTLITDLPRWRAFLRRRHRTPAGMSTAWGRTIVSFDAVQAPDRLSDAGVATHLPNTSAALADWLDWQRLVVPARLAAHRFTVVLQRPDEDDLRRDPDLLRRIKDAVVRVIQAEKPAHTAFDVVYDDLLFRPEHNRLGRDSVVAPDVEVGSALELGAAALGETWVVAAFPVLPRAPSGAWLSPVPVPPEST